MSVLLILCGFRAGSIAAPPPALPPLQAHPLPETLANWQDPSHAGDYFDQLRPVDVGYLIWSEFPIRVYLQPPTEIEATNPFTAKRSRAWIATVQTAVQEWMTYLPLQIVEQPTHADIAIFRVAPPLRIDKQSANSASGKLPTLRARNAETRFELYAQRSPVHSVLAHRFTIDIRPDLPTDYLLATARHELGHALGIWGHSPNPTDAMYFSQVRNPAQISARDLNTLKRVYEQPTRLGGALS